jgi:hypothetical protein
LSGDLKKVTVASKAAISRAKPTAVRKPLPKSRLTPPEEDGLLDRSVVDSIVDDDDDDKDKCESFRYSSSNEVV